MKRKMFAFCACLMIILTSCEFETAEDKTPKTGTYTVNHYQQNVTGDGYTLFESEQFEGKDGEATAAVPKTYGHFAAEDFVQGIISADGSTVVNIYYNREIITLVFEANGGTWSDGTAEAKTLSGRYGAVVVFADYPQKTGYGMSWNKEVQVIFSSNETYTAQYEAGAVNYKVEHYLQNIEDDNYSEEPYETELKTGTSDTQTAATVKNYEGFENLAVTQKTIAADGSTVVRIQYERKKYTVSFESNCETTVASQNVKYGAKATATSILVKTGYDFKGWYISTDGGMTLSENSFDFNTEITGILSLYAKWEIKHFTVTFNSMGGSGVSEQTVDYGFKANEPSVPEKAPYDFAGWFTSSDDGETLSNTAFSFNTEIQTSITLFAKWEFNLSNCTADNVVEKIAAMTKSGTVAVNGVISDETLTSIKNAINEKSFGIGLDLTGTNGLSSIKQYAFFGCTNLTSIEIPDSVVQIGYQAFYGCTNLTSIELPDTVTSIGVEAFGGCKNLTSIELPDSVVQIGDKAFNGCEGLTSIEIPSGVTHLAAYAFSGCTNLTSIELPDTVTSISVEAFGGCKNLTSIELPDSVTYISTFVFSGCTNLTSIELPDSVTNIGAFVFEGCTSLTSILFAGTMEQWNVIKKEKYWNQSTAATKVICSDGEVEL